MCVTDVASQERKRDGDGCFKHAATGGCSVTAVNDSSAAARWSNNHGFASAAKRVAGGSHQRGSIHNQQHQDPIEVDDDSDSQHDDSAQPGIQWRPPGWFLPSRQ